MKNRINIKKIFAAAAIRLAIIALFVTPLHAQVAVAPLQLVRQQFFSMTGVPLAGGCLAFSAAGGSTPQAIYSDSTGNFQLSNPVQLDSGGMTSIWMTNTSYRITASTGVSGQTCAAFPGSQIWVQDFVNPYSILNGLQNITLSPVTVDPAGTPGMLGFRSDLNCLRFFSSIWDCVATLTATQSFLNHTFDVSTNSLVNVTNTSGHYIRNNGTKYVDSILNMSDGLTIYQNSGATAPIVNLIAKFAGSATVAQTTDTNGFIGICINNCSLGAQGQYQSSGIGSCVFDGSTTVNDYVVNSTTITGNCHDSGVAPPAILGTTVQIIGRVLSNNVGAGTYTLELFPPEITFSNKQGAALGCTNFTPVTVVNNNTLQTLLSCPIAANSLLQGSLLNVDLTGLESTAVGQTITISASLGAGTICSSTFTGGVANNQPYNFVAKFATLTAGAGGTGNWACEIFGPGTAVAGNNGVVGTPTISINTTISNNLLLTVQMSVANPSNLVIGQLLKAVIY